MASNGEKPQTPYPTKTSIRYCALAAVIMAYGWAYRGTVGHEAGAMVPAALLGLVLCLASGRFDWHRRAAVVGLFAAVGWAWGGSISYMEQTFYVLSDSFPDVLYGYTMLFFIGALWAGCGGALLGLGLTEPRSELECLTRPFIAVGVVFFLFFLYFFFVPEHNEAYETFTVLHFHDGDWLSATLTLLVSATYWAFRPKDRRGAALIFSAAAAWWIGYGLLTKLGGLRLAPLHRSESWGGILGVLVVLILYLVRRKNYAALMLCLYGCVGGGFAFALAVFIHHPLALHWGPFAEVSLPIPSWRCAEVSFGFFMGLAMALGALRLIKGGIASPKEDSDRTPLDTFAVFTITVVLAWMNFRRHTERVLNHSLSTDDNTLFGLSTEVWYFLLGLLVTIPALRLLRQYQLGNRDWAPRSAFGKGAAVVLLITWATAAAQLLDQYPSRESLLANLCLWLPAALATWLLVSFARDAAKATMPSENHTEANIPACDSRWRVGRPFAIFCAMMPVLLLVFTGLSMAMQDGPPGTRGRLRFGPNAYWQQTARLQGTWDVMGFAKNPGEEIASKENLPYTQFEFDSHRNITTTSPNGERVDSHRWFLKNQYIWLHWYGKAPSHQQQAQVPLQFQEGRLYITWPPHKKDKAYLVLQRH